MTKSLPDIGDDTIQDVGPLDPRSLASTPAMDSKYSKLRAISGF